jgi:hypothetical protein
MKKIQVKFRQPIRKSDFNLLRYKSPISGDFIFHISHTFYHFEIFDNRFKNIFKLPILMFSYTFSLIVGMYQSDNFYCNILSFLLDFNSKLAGVSVYNEHKN